MPQGAWFTSDNIAETSKGEIANGLEEMQFLSGFSVGFLYLYHPLFLLSMQIPGSITVLQDLLSWGQALVTSPSGIWAHLCVRITVLSIPSLSNWVSFVTLRIELYDFWHLKKKEGGEGDRHRETEVPAQNVQPFPVLTNK